MNRQKFVDSEDYREGFKDGVKAGRLQMISNVKIFVSTIMENVNALSKKIEEFEKE